MTDAAIADSLSGFTISALSSGLANSAIGSSDGAGVSDLAGFSSVFGAGLDTSISSSKDSQSDSPDPLSGPCSRLRLGSLSFCKMFDRFRLEDEASVLPYSEINREKLEMVEKIKSSTFTKTYMNVVINLFLRLITGGINTTDWRFTVGSIVTKCFFICFRFRSSCITSFRF